MTTKKVLFWFFVAGLVLSFLGCARLNWNMAQEKDSIGAYEEFLYKYSYEADCAHMARIRLRSKYVITKDEIYDIYVHDDETPFTDDNISRLILAGANFLDSRANCIDPVVIEQVSEILERVEPERVVASFIRVVMTRIDRRKVLFFAARMGTPGAGKALNDLLMEYGDRAMAEDYLNSGSAELENGGRYWASKHDLMVVPDFGVTIRR